MFARVQDPEVARRVARFKRDAIRDLKKWNQADEAKRLAKLDRRYRDWPILIEGAYEDALAGSRLGKSYTMPQLFPHAELTPRQKNWWMAENYRVGSYQDNGRRIYLRMFTPAIVQSHDTEIWSYVLDNMKSRRQASPRQDVETVLLARLLSAPAATQN